jgi:fibronectin-binding autotransporter adhesin
MCVVLTYGSAFAAVKHWISGGGTCASFESDLCWSGTAGGANNRTHPVAGDDVMFDSNYTGNCTFNPSATETMTSIAIAAGYTGTLTMAHHSGLNPDLNLTGDFSMSNGTVNLSGALMAVATTFKVFGGTFNAGSGTLAVTGATTIKTGGTFDGQTASSLSFTGAVAVGVPANAGTMSMGTGTVSLGGALTADGSGTTVNGNSSTLTIAGDVAIDNSAVFHAGSGTKTLNGQLTLGATIGSTVGTFDFGTATVNLNNAGVTTLKGGSTFSGSTGTVNFAAGITLTSGNMNLSTATSAAFTSGAIIVSAGTFTVPAGTVTLPSTLNVNGATAVFTRSSGTTTFTGLVTINSAGTFNAGTGSVNFSNGITLTNGNMDLSTVTPTVTAGTVTITAGDTLTVGSNPGSFAGPVTVAGTLTGGSGGLTFSGAVTVSGTFSGGSGARTFSGAVTNSAGTMNLSSAASLNFSSGTLTVSGSGITTLSSQTVTFSALTVSGGTFNVGTASVTVSGAATFSSTANLSTATSLSFPGSVAVSGGVFTISTQTVTMGSLTVNGGTFTLSGTRLTVSGAALFSSATDLSTATSLTFSGSFTVSAGTMTLGSQTLSMGSLTVSGGALQGGTSVLTVTGATTSDSTLNMGSTTSGPTFQGDLSITGGATTLGSGTAAIQGALTVSGGTFNAGDFTTAALTITGATHVNGGTFKSNKGALTFSGNTSIDSGSAFSCNTGNLTFNGSVTVGGVATAATLHANSATINFAFPTTLIAPDSLLIQGTSSTLFNDGVANISFGTNAIAGTNSIDVVAGKVDLSSNASTTFGANGNITVAAGGTLLTNTGAAPTTTFPKTVTVAGTMTGAAGDLVFAGPVTVSGTFSGGNGARSFSTAASTLTVTGSGTYRPGTGAQTFNGAVSTAGTFDLATSSPALTFGASSSLTVSGGATTFGAQNPVTVTSLSVSSGTFNAGTSKLTVSGATNITGGTVTLSSTRVIVLTGAVAINAGTLTLGSSSSTVTVTGATTVTGSGIFTAGSCTGLSFNGGLTLGTSPATSSPGTFNGGTATTTIAGTTIQDGSTFNVGAATSITFNTTFSLLGSSAFNGMTGITTFSVAPALTSGTFSVGTAGTAGRHTFSQSTTFDSGATLSFPSDKGELRLANTKVLTLNGPVTSDVGTASTLPKIDCNGCAAGITVAFGATSTINVNGLEIDNSIATGVTIASGVTFTTFKRFKFASNVGGAGSRHLDITLGTAVVNAPGFYFDNLNSVVTNVRLNGTSGQNNGAHLIMEFQSTGTNGLLAGEAADADGDTNNDGFGENLASPYFGSVIEWVGASPSDTAGTAVGFPAAAFDWNTFTYYGVYVAYKNIGGAGTADRLWLRNTDGSAAYFYDVADASGDMVGAPFWDSINEVTAGLDVNGDGDMLDTSVHVIYIGTSLGHIIKLIDNGTSLAMPASGLWSTDFQDATKVTTISSPLSADSNNLYFGGTDPSTATKIFGVQIAAGGSQKTVVKNIGSVGAITAALAWRTYTGTTYVFLGSVAAMSQAYIYRVDMGAGSVNASYNGATTTINGSVRVINNRAYAATDGGKVFALDAANFGVGGFTDMPGTTYPYTTAALSPIKGGLYIDPASNYVYFGDNAGNLYVLTSTGAALANYPYPLTGTAHLTSAPIYIPGSGVIAIGASDGVVYFVDRRNGSNMPSLLYRYTAGTGSVSSVAWNASTSQYMVSTSDGKLTYINSSDVPDLTNGTE